jgi:hypothetical protein
MVEGALTVWVVYILTTVGPCFSAKSAKVSGLVAAAVAESGRNMFGAQMASRKKRAKNRDGVRPERE